MILKKLFLPALFLLFSITCSAGQDTTVSKVVTHYYSLHGGFTGMADVWGNYTLDMTFESMLFYDMYSRNKTYTPMVLGIMKMRKYSSTDIIPFENQPFCSINHTLFLATGDSNYLKNYLSESTRMMTRARYSTDGAIMMKDGDNFYLLIDYLQEYASRMAKTGFYTKNQTYYLECLNQFKTYRRILRNPGTGLWSQGRGWMNDLYELSPCAWSRGQGWLMRGMVTSLQYLPAGSNYYLELQKILIELSDALLKVQDPDGMWHQLPDQPFSDSYPETSGTGMIAYYMALALKEGFLDGAQYLSAVRKAEKSLLSCIKNDGTVTGACRGPGPLISTESYLRKSAPNDEDHGVQAIIYSQCIKLLISESQ